MDLEGIGRLRRWLKYILYFVLLAFVGAYATLCYRANDDRNGAGKGSGPDIVGERLELLVPEVWPVGSDDYMLFTPAAIELRDEKFLSQNVYFRNRNMKDFFVRSIERLPYRLQLEGYMALSNRSFCFFIRDGRSGMLHRGTVGDAFPMANFRIDSFELETVETNGFPANVVHVKIFDQEDEKIVDLVSMERKMTDAVRVTLAVLADGEMQNYGLDTIGEEIVVANHRFQLLRADPMMAVIQRTNLAGENPRVEIFYPSGEKN